MKKRYNWIEDLSEEITGIRASRISTQSWMDAIKSEMNAPMPKKIDDSSWSLIILASFMAIVLMVAFEMKTGKGILDLFNKPHSVIVQKESTESKIAKIETNIADIKEKIRILGILHNHNTAVLQSFSFGNELIAINRDWTVNRVPNRIIYQPDDFDFIKKQVKKF